MSSFVINKKEYIKAAGAVAGLADVHEIWYFSYETQRNMNADDYYNKFVECFEMNALSVQEQYKDKDVWTDSNDYKAEFKKAFNYSKFATMDYRKEQELVFELLQFFSSAEYQTEKESYYYKMKMFFNQILVSLFKAVFMKGYESESWGSFNIAI